LDLSKNKLKVLPDKISSLQKLKSLNISENKLSAGSVNSISSLSALQTLLIGKNQLGIKKNVSEKLERGGNYNILPDLPSGIKQLKIEQNSLTSIPMQMFSLTKLEKLDLSCNKISIIPSEISKLINLTELNLDHNNLVSVPEECGELKKLKSLSLRGNRIHVTSTKFSETNPQPLPSVLFTSTPVIDLNLQGNDLTNTQLNEFKGFSSFLERRKEVKSKNLGALSDLSVCGLE